MFPAHLKEESVRVAEAEGSPAPDYVLPNGLGLGYGHFELDESTREYLLENLPRITRMHNLRIDRIGGGGVANVDETPPGSMRAEFTLSIYFVDRSEDPDTD